MRDIIREEKMLAPDASETELSFTAVGEGIAPMNTVSTAQALALAKEQRLQMLTDSLQVSFMV